MKKIIIAAFLLLLIVGISAEVHTPSGRWKTIDDETGEEKSVVRIWIEDGVLYGKIDSLFLEPDEDPNPVCDECKGKNKDKPIIGMTIMENLSRKGIGWSGGTILDPDNGKTYKCKIEIIENGERLKLRGFLGISLLGRTQYWIRVK
ncbi:MAG: DUF2147 domain-containing protein [Candidatus Cloacimonetes bacterium]|nr:DUF2147 domain-containing protein [Candidatus Cloacimonadota bacterium]